SAADTGFAEAVIAVCRSAGFSSAVRDGLGHVYATMKMISADNSGQGAIRKRPPAKSDCWTLAVPTRYGPSWPPRLPIMLMKPIADAAFAAPRNLVGMGQKPGRCAYIKGPMQKIITSTGNTGIPVKATARKTPQLESDIGTPA